MDLDAAFAEPTRRPWESRGDGVLRFAMVGLGWWTRDQALPAVAAADNCEATVLVSRSPGKRRTEREAWPSVTAAMGYEQFEQGAAADEYDAVYVCTPNATHLRFVEAAAEYGKAVLCEKPIESTVDRAEQLVAAVRERGVPLMVAYRMQTDPVVRRLRRVVRAGAIGDPVFVHGSMSQRLLDIFEGGDNWRLDPDLVGRGTSLMDLGVYPVNTTRFVLDEDPVSVTASARSDHPAFDGVPDERATFSVAFDGGTRLQASVSQNAYGSAQFDIVGTEGSIRLRPAFFDHATQRLEVSAGGQTVRREYEPADQMREEFAFFADRVLAGDPLEADGEHGLVDLRTIDAAYTAAEAGTTQPVE